MSPEPTAETTREAVEEKTELEASPESSPATPEAPAAPPVETTEGGTEEEREEARADQRSVAGLAEIEFPDMDRAGQESDDASQGDPERNIELLKDVNLRVKIELGRGKMLLRDVLRLVEGSVVELDKLAGDPLDIYVNDRLVGKGEVLVLNDNFCVRITQVFSPEECLSIKGKS